MKNLLLLSCFVLFLAFPAHSQLWLTEELYKVITPTSATSTSPEYDFTMVKNMQATHLFHRTYTLTAGQSVPISVSNASSNSNLFFFYVSNPDTYSIAFQTKYDGIGNVYYGDTVAVVPESGDYMLLLVPAVNGTASCQLSVRDSSSSVNYNRMYFSCVQGTEKAYNTFVNSNHGTCDLFVVEGENPGKIVGYSNGYDDESGFDWGTTARIRKKYSNPTSGVYVSLNMEPGMSLPDNWKLNLFAGLKEEKKMRVYFTNLQQEDAIRTASATGEYNCIAWAGGEWSHWVWPPSEFSDVLSSSDIASFDSYFESRGLVRNDAAEGWALVDLWAKIDGTDTIYTHASVRANSNIYTYGYGWESKAGSLERILHPRYALSGNNSRGYGQVVHHYVKKPIQIVPGPIGGHGHVLTLEPIFENVEFTQAELLDISSQIMNIPSSIVDDFEYAYGIVKDSLNNSSFSNLDLLLENEDYLDLLILCLDEPQTQFLIYQKLSQGDILSVKMIEDILVADNLGTMNQVRNYINTHQVNAFGQKIRRTLQSNATLFAKYMMNANLQNGLSNEDVSYSDDTKVMNVIVSGNDVYITFSLSTDAVVTLNMASSFGQGMRNLLNQERIGQGKHEMAIHSVQKGLYTVNCLINGKIFSKKIAVR